MRKKQVVPKPERPVREGVSIRVRFASHKQINLVKAAAARRGIARDLFIQRVLQASAEKVLAEPIPPPLEHIAPQV